jgi:hypothetical protein
VVIVGATRFQSPTVFMSNSLETSALEARVWRFNFTRALNITMTIKSPFVIDLKSIDINLELARGVGNFQVQLR